MAREKYRHEYVLVKDEGYLEMHNGAVIFNSNDYEITDQYESMADAIRECEYLNLNVKLEGNEVTFTSVVIAVMEDDDIVEYGETIHDQARWELEHEFKLQQEATA